MMTEENTRGLNFLDHSAEVLDETAVLLLKQQSGILYTYYNKRTGILQSHLNSRPFTVRKTGAGVNLILDYMSQIRFMDLKKTATGKNKRLYHQIYNKPLYGFLFGYAYHRLRLGFLNYLRQETTAKVNSLYIEIPI